MIRHFLVWLIITVISIVLLPWFVSGETYLAKVKADQRQLVEEIGEESANYIILKADRIYADLFINSGFQPWVFQRYQIGKRNESTDLLEQNQFEKAGQSARRYVAAFFASMYEAVYRLTQLSYWAVFASPFVLAAAFDGLMQRNVRIASFQYSSPAKYNALWHFLIALGACTTIYCNLPFQMDAVVYPTIVFIAAMTVRTLLANLQRSA